MLRFGWLLPVLLVCLGTKPRLAVVSSETPSPPSQQVLDLLETSLSSQPELDLLTRRELMRLTREQGLQNLAADEAVRLGEILPVDLFLFVARESAKDDPLLSLRAVEARTGLVLAMRLATASDVMEDQTMALTLAQQAVESWRVPPHDRHLVALLSCRSEMVSTELDEAADALAALVLTDLARVPGVLIADRRHQQHLLQEETLAGLDRNLSASGWLLNIGLKLQGDDWLIALEATPAGDVSKLQRQLTVPPSVANARQAIIQALTEHLAVNPPPSQAPAKEAASFHRLATYDLFPIPERLAYAAAAYALEPRQDYLLTYAMLAEYNEEENWNGYVILDPYKYHYNFHKDEAWMGELACSLYERYYRRELANATRKVEELNLFQFPPKPRPADWTGMTTAQIERERNVLRLRLTSYMAEDFRKLSPYNAILDSLRIAPRWCVDLEEFSRYVVDTQAFLQLPIVSSKVWYEGRFWRDLSNVTKKVSSDPEQLEAYIEHLRGVVHPGYTLSAYAAAMTSFSYHDRERDRKRREAAKPLLNFYRKHRTWFEQEATPSMRAVYIEWAFEALVYTCPKASLSEDPETAAQWQQAIQILEELLTGPVKAKDYQQVAEWLLVSGIIKNPGDYGVVHILRQRPESEAVAFLSYLRDEVAAALAQPRLDAALKGSLQRGLLKLDQALAAHGQKVMEVPEVWRPYTMEQLDWPKPPGEGWRVVGVQDHPSSNQAAIVWYQAATKTLQASLVNLTTGATNLLKTTSVLPFRYDLTLATDGQNVAVAFRGGGIGYIEQDQYRHFDKRELPFPASTALALYDHHLYVWSSQEGRSALVRVDLETNEMEDIFTTNAVVSEHPLAGDPKVNIRGMYVDQEQGQILLGVSVAGKPLSGVWALDPKNNSIRRISGEIMSTSTIMPHGEYILVGDRTYVQALHRETHEQLPLAAYWTKVPIAYYVGHLGYDWPVAWFGEELIAAGQHNSAGKQHTSAGTIRHEPNEHLHLFRPDNKPPVALGQLPDGQPPAIRAMIWQGPRHFLFIRENGDIWRVTRAPYNNPEHPWPLHFGKVYDKRLEQAMGGPALKVQTVTASSERTRPKGKTWMWFSPMATLREGHRHYWWTKPNDQIGAWIEYAFSQPTTIGQMAIMNGWNLGQSRIKQLTVIADGREHQTIDLAATKVAQIITLDEPVTATNLRLRVDDVYPVSEENPDDGGLTLSTVAFFAPKR